MESLHCEIKHTDACMTVILHGSVDHHTVKAVREEIDLAISRYLPKQAVLDLGHVEFMDSSGLGLILGRYTKLQDLGGALTLRGIDAEIMKIVKLAGLEKFIPIETKKGGQAS